MEEERIGHQPEKEIIFPSRKSFRKQIMPAVGYPAGDCKVIYVHETKLRFTASGKVLPAPGQVMSIDGKIFQVEYVDNDKHRYSAHFIGFEKPAEPAAPPGDSTEITKLID